MCVSEWVSSWPRMSLRASHTKSSQRKLLSFFSYFLSDSDFFNCRSQIRSCSFCFCFLLFFFGANFPSSDKVNMEMTQNFILSAVAISNSGYTLIMLTLWNNDDFYMHIVTNSEGNYVITCDIAVFTSPLLFFCSFVEFLLIILLFFFLFPLSTSSLSRIS